MSKLSKRLEIVASFIDENDKSVIDIGCDHGLLSIYLAEKFNNLKIIASDVNNSALESARRNVSKCKLEDRIDIRLGSGISVINKKDKYTRNRYRKKILPFLKKEDKNVHEKFIKFSNVLNEYNSYFSEKIEKIINQ